MIQPTRTNFNPPALPRPQVLAWFIAIALAFTVLVGCGMPNATAQPAPIAQSAETAPGSLELAQLRHEMTALNNRVVQLETRVAQLEQSANAVQSAPPPEPVAEPTATELTATEPTIAEPPVSDTPTETQSGTQSEAQSEAQSDAAPLALIPTAAPESVAPASADPPTASVAWDAAAPYLGQTTTVCGPVAAAQFAQQTNGQPTFLNLGKAFPAPDRFQVVIWGNQRANFPTPPEIAYANTTICVTGTVEAYRGTLEITVHQPDQIQITGE